MTFFFTHLSRKQVLEAHAKVATLQRVYALDPLGVYTPHSLKLEISLLSSDRAPYVTYAPLKIFDLPLTMRRYEGFMRHIATEAVGGTLVNFLEKRTAEQLGKVCQWGLWIIVSEVKFETPTATLSGLPLSPHIYTDVMLFPGVPTPKALFWSNFHANPNSRAPRGKVTWAEPA